MKDEWLDKAVRLARKNEKKRAEQYEARVQHVLTIDVPAWQSGRGDWHTAKLLALIAKSDLQNRERHRLGFPAEVEAYERWQRG